MRRTTGIISASILLLGAGVWSLASPARRARLPWMPDQAQALLERTPCGETPKLIDAQLIAALRADLVDPCGHLDQAIPAHPAAERWLQEHVLASLTGPESLRLRAAQSLVRRKDTEAAAEELGTGHLGPEARSALLRALEPDLEVLDLPFDPSGRSAALRFSRGDWSAREELADALYAELRWPTVVNPQAAPEQSARPQALVDGTLKGLGWSSELLAQALVDLEQGDPIQVLEGPSLRALQAGGSDCSQADPACLEFLLNELDGHAGPPQEAMPMLEGIAQDDQALFYRAAESVRSSPHPGGRLLGLVAHPAHSYGPEAWAAGQRGEPALVLRYGGGTPAASASAALALGEAAELPVRVYGRDSDTLVIEVEGLTGSRRATVGPCGPGSAAWQDGLPQLDADEVHAWAFRERIAGLAAAGDLQGAVMASTAEWGSIRTPQWMALHGGLLACQGIRHPALKDAALAQSWTQACSDLDRPALKPAEASTCQGSLWVALPAEGQGPAKDD